MDRAYGTEREVSLTFPTDWNPGL